MAPLTPLQRLVAKLLPWFDPDAQEQRLARTELIRQRSIRARLTAERLAAYQRLTKR